MRMRDDERLPSHAAMAWPVLEAMKRAGGSATNEEILRAVADDLDLTQQQRTMTRTRKGSRTQLDYRLAWSRTLLKNMGAITNDAPRTWSVTEAGYKVSSTDIQAVVKAMLDNLQQSLQRRQNSRPQDV